LSDNIYIARQPIVDDEKKIYGYELLFRSMENDGLAQANFNDGTIASSRVAVNALNHIGLNKLVGDELAFINIDSELLLSSAILSIPKEHFVLELLETIEVDDEIIERVIELKKLGYKFALDDASCKETFMENFKSIFPYLYILKLDCTLIDKKTFAQRVENVKEYEFKLLAEKVETQEDFEYFKEIGCSYFQGYFFAKPSLLTQKALDPMYNEVFRLINYLDDESSIEEISMAFESSPDITIQLLKFMNSGSMALKSNIRSIKHAIALLGRAPLKRWLLLISFSKSSVAVDGMRSPIITMAQNRAKLMNEVVTKMNIDVNKDEAALVGILSLIDVITGCTMEDVLKELTLSSSINEALLEDEGDLGLLIKLVICLESLDCKQNNKIMNTPDFSFEHLNEALIQSYNI